MFKEQGYQSLRPDIIHDAHKNISKYKKISQIALYSNLDHVGKMNIFTKSLCDVESNVVFCFDATKIENNGQDAMYFMVRVLDEQVPRLKNLFSIAYIHSSIKLYNSFRSYVQFLPAEYLVKLKTLYVVNGGKSTKIYSKFKFGALNRFLQEKTQHVANIQEIQNQSKISLGCTKIGYDTQTIKPMLQSINIEAPPIIKNQLYGRNIEQYELNEHKIPKLIHTLIGTIYSSPQQLQKQGIMRKSCNVEILETLQDSIICESDPYSFIRKFDDLDVVAGCLKKIFNNLNTPLFNYELYDEIVSYRDEGIPEHTLSFIKGCIEKMGEVNRAVFVFICCFFLEGIVAHEQMNKMSVYNLAVVFGPCFFRPKTYKLEDLLNSGKFSWFIKYSLQHFKEIHEEKVIEKVHELLEQSKQ